MNDTNKQVATDAGQVARKTKQERRLEIWNNMTPEQRDYDRFMAGQIPFGASWNPETTWGILQGRARLEAMVADPACQGCACHRNPPCFHCEENHRDHDVDDHEPADDWEIEVAELEAYEENASRERGARWADYVAKQEKQQQRAFANSSATSANGLSTTG